MKNHRTAFGCGIVVVVALGVLLGAISPATSPPATETTLSALNAKVTAVNTGSVAIGAALPAGTANIGSVTIAGTTPVSLGSISINGTAAVSGPLTDTQLRATAVPISLGSISINGTAAVSGPLTDTQLRASAVPISLGSISINGAIPSGTNTIGSVTLNSSSANIGSVTLAGTSAVSLASITLNTGGNNVGSVTLATGANAIGKLAANSGVVIGDVNAVQSGTWTVTQQSITKGTQGSTGVTTQDLKDAGRTAINLYAVAAAAGTTGTETAITLTKSSGTSATSTGTSFVVTNGKRFRITEISVATRGHATATIQTTTFSLRLNTAGAVTTSSTPILLQARSATPATASAWDRVILPIPDGFEIAGDGTAQIGVTAAATYTTNAPTWDVNIIGYEY